MTDAHSGSVLAVLTVAALLTSLYSGVGLVAAGETPSLDSDATVSPEPAVQTVAPTENDTGQVTETENTTETVTDGTENTTETVTNETENTTETVTNETEDTTETVTDGTEDTTETVTNETENATETVTNETENTTETVTNETETTSGTVEDTAESVAASTTNSTTDLTNATTETVENTTGSVTNATESTIATVTNDTEQVLEDTLSVDASITATASVGSSVSVGANTSLSATTDSGTTPSSTEPAPGARHTASSDEAGLSHSETATGTATAAVAPAAEDRSSPLPAPSGAAAGGALVVTGVAVVAGSKHVVTSASATRGRELPRLGRSVRFQAQGAVDALRSTIGRLPRVILPPGYSRYDDSDPLEHETRRSLFEAVERSPGVNLSMLADETDGSLSTVRHHLRILEAEHLLGTKRIRGQRRYFLSNESEPALVAALDDTATEPILRTLAQTGSATVSDLADALGRDPSTISHHLSRLEDDGLIERERDGRSVENSLATTAERVLASARGATETRRSVATE